MSDDTDLTLRDRKLLEHAANGYSGEEMQQALGIPAAQAIVRVRELLAAKDVWDQIEQRKLLMHSMFRLKEKLETDFEIDYTKPKEVEAYNKVVNTISSMLDKQGRISEDELRIVTEVQARELLRLVEAGYQRARQLLADEYANLVDLDEIDSAFQQGMREALIDG